MTQEPKNPDRLAQLAETATALLEQIETLHQDRGNQLVKLSRRSVTNRRLAWLAIVGFVLDVILTVIMAVGLIRLDNNASEIDALTQRLNTSQSTTRQKALCPMYQVFLDLRSPEGRKRSPDPEKYDRAFEVIQDGYDVLKCAEFVEGGQSWKSKQSMYQGSGGQQR